MRTLLLMTNRERLRAILQYTLLIASEADEACERWLSPLHLVKHLYLADLHYASHNDGQVFTGLAWKFHHFGPWSSEAFLAIDEALPAIGAEKSSFPSEYGDKDCVRWRIEPDPDALQRLKQELPLEIKSSVQHYVNRYKNNTTALLHFVYSTPPMLRAAPSEMLDFSCRTAPEEADAEPYVPLMDRLSKKQKKALKAGMDDLRLRFKQQESARSHYPAPPPGRQDKVYEQGLQWLDGLGGSPFPEKGATVEFSEHSWKSAARSGDG